MLQIQRILFPTDFSTCSKQALRHALHLAHTASAELHLLHAVTLHGELAAAAEIGASEPDDLLHQLAESADTELGNLIDSGLADQLEVRKALRRGLYPGGVILEYANEQKIDLIVLGTHGRHGPERLLLGSVAEEVVRLARCPVLTQREQEKRPDVTATESILVPVDFSEHSRQAVRYGAELARAYDAGLQLLHVVEQQVVPSFYYPSGELTFPYNTDDVANLAREALGDLADELELEDLYVARDVVQGRAAQAILRYAEDAGSDLIVIATHGLTGMKRMLAGSTAEEVVRDATCPVFTVKSFGKRLL